MTAEPDSPTTEDRARVSQPTRRTFSLGRIAERWSLLIAFVVAFAFFSAAKPSVFLTWANAQSILDNASIPVILAVGVTVVLVLGEFDLSVGAIVGVAGAASAAVMSYRGWPTSTAILLAVGVGTAIGIANGVFVARIRIPSFVATLAMGSLAGGIELAITQSSIFEGLNQSYLDIALTSFHGVSLNTFIAAGIAVLFLVILRTTVYGRYAAAVGDNPAAARLAGVPVQRVKVIGFMLAGLAAGVASVISVSSAASYYPGIGPGYLLPAYAAAFLGSSLTGGVRFSVIGSVLGVLLLGTVTTGLNILNQPNWAAALVQGGVLLAAVAGIAIRQQR